LEPANRGACTGSYKPGRGEPQRQGNGAFEKNLDLREWERLEKLERTDERRRRTRCLQSKKRTSIHERSTSTAPGENR